MRCIMYFIVLSVGAYTLLLSSFITIVIMLRKQFKHWIYTPIYIFSISDVLFSILTSSILLVNYVEKIAYLYHNNSYIFPLNNSIWHEEDGFNRICENFNNITNQSDFSITSKCNIIDVMIKYGMLFIPFTNSFVSLLIFSVQCNLTVICFKNQCFKFLESQECVMEKTYENKNTANKSKPQNVEKCETVEYDKIQFDSKSNLTKHTNISTVKQNTRKFLQAFKCDEMKKDNKKITSVFVITQWIVPIFVTGILYLTEYDNKSYIKNTESTKCLIENNFFFYNCHSNFKFMNIPENYSEIYTIPLYKDYIDNQDLVNLPNSSNTQANEIVTKVQTIIYSVLNDTYNVSNNMYNANLYNTSLLFDTMKDLQFNTHTTITNYYNNSIVDVETNSTENALIKEYENSYDITNTENSTSLINYVQPNNNTNDYNEKLLSFNHLVLNSSENTLVRKNNSKNEITNITERLESDKFYTDNFQTTANELAEVTMQHNASIMQNKLNKNQQYNRKQQKYKKTEENFQHNSTVDHQNMPSVIEITIYQNDNISKITSIYIMHICFISTQFLKLHLLVLIFIIYFLPILFSSILQQHGKMNCQIALNRLKVKNEMLLINSNDNFVNNINDTSFNSCVDYKEVSETKQDAMQSNGNFEELNKDLNVLEQSEMYNEDSNNDRNEQHMSIEYDRKKMYLKLAKQMENNLQLLNTMKISLLSGILLWTPIFLEVLFKVFTHLYIPEWFLNITYLGGIAFGILRNIFNLKMIKLQEIDTSITKTNSVYPIK